MSDTAPLWQACFPELARSREAALAALRQRARRVVLPAERTVFHAGSSCKSYLLVTAGSVRVVMVAEGGREAVLYRVGPGQTCILTTSCLLAGETYPAEGVTESEVEALALSHADFEHGLDHSPAFRRFVFANLGRRLAEVIQRMDAVAFQSIERRLAQYLLFRSDTEDRVHATHRDIAIELGSAREVVSRYLKRLESRNLVELRRASIRIRDREGLAALGQPAV